MIARSTIVLALVLCCSFSYAEDAVEIPLSEVWALDMPGTRDVRELEPDIYGKRGKRLPIEVWRALEAKSLIWQIRSELHLKHGKLPKRGFAVSGTGLQALKATRDGFAGEREVSDVLPAESDIAAVFSSLQFGHYVRIYDVVRQGNVFEIRYRFVPHEYGYIIENFALIPLGKLPRGMYQVKFVQGPMEEQYLRGGFRPVAANTAEKVISGSFKFITKK